ncbi:MAG: SGNH/GDSL hydrolase family protein [Chitinophagaceae bacterium]|nr:MAG: SGNH/GDSL hydrolase family protein [Chitinophagaceae bacterium]
MKQLLFIICVFTCCIAFQKPGKTWVAIGDSITYLNDHPEQTGNRVNKGYLTLVKEKIQDLTVINQGHNGWTSGDIAAKIDSLGLVKADIYTVFLGTNDWWRGRPLGMPDDFKNNTGNATVHGSFRIIIDKLRALNPAAEIILITPLQRSDFVYINNGKNNAWGSYKPKNDQTLKQFADAIVALARAEKIKVVDLYNKSGINQQNLVRYKRLKDPQTGKYKNYRYPAFTTIPYNPETDEYPYPHEAVDMTYDGLHPSDKGNKVIADMLARVMR